MLKNSVRNSIPWRSVTRNVLVSEKSQSMIPGPIIVLRPALPRRFGEATFTSTMGLMEPTWLFVMMLALVAAPGEVIVNGRPAVVIESPAAKLVVDLGDGSIVDFHLGPRAAVQHVR